MLDNSPASSSPGTPRSTTKQRDIVVLGARGVGTFSKVWVTSGQQWLWCRVSLLLLTAVPFAPPLLPVLLLALLACYCTPTPIGKSATVIQYVEDHFVDGMSLHVCAGLTGGAHTSWAPVQCTTPP